MAVYIVPEDTLREQAATAGMTHLSTGIAVMRAGKILAVRRTANDYLGGSYELPGGGVDAGESLAESVTRELREETGLTLKRIIGMFPGFEYSTPQKPKVRQLNFLVEASGEVKLSEEHDDFVWLDETMLASIEATESMIICFQAALALSETLQETI